MSDFEPVDVFDEMEPVGGAGTVEPQDQQGAPFVVEGETQDQVVTDGERIKLTAQRGSITDPDSGASLKLDDFEIEGGASERGVDFHARGTNLNLDSGDALGPVKISGHLFEAEGYGSASVDKTGLGGHVDVAGADIQIGDKGTHIKGGVSFGEGLGVEFATGEDSDGDGYGEWGMKGEAHIYSGDVRFEPGAVYDGAVETGEQVLLDAADTGVQARHIADDFAEDPEGMTQQWSDDAEKATDDAWGTVGSYADDLAETVQTGLDAGALDPSVPSDGVTLEGAQSAWETVTSSTDDLIETAQTGLDSGALDPSTPYEETQIFADDLIETVQTGLDGGALAPSAGWGGSADVTGDDATSYPSSAPDEYEYDSGASAGSSGYSTGESSPAPAYEPIVEQSTSEYGSGATAGYAAEGYTSSESHEVTDEY